MTRIAIRLALALPLLLAACSSDGLGLGDDDAGNNGNELGAQAQPDLAPAPIIDMAVGTGEMGSMCTGNCECTPGLICLFPFPYPATLPKDPSGVLRRHRPLES